MFDERYTATCRIYNMLKGAQEHISFHTPGHKIGKWDITELSFSDNLSCPTGVLKEAQRDVARTLGADRSFLLTDGSTAGVLSMLYACKAKRILFASASHKSVYNACKLLRLKKCVLPTVYSNGIPRQPTADEIEKALQKTPCQAVVLTSPDYYGNVADFENILAVCRRHGASLLCDGAHGGHLHGTQLYAGNYCDMWVDGVHKDLPAFTQGAVVSAKKGFSDALAEGVDIFRTTSPNYVILASVEYAVKYPRQRAVEARAEELKRKFSAYPNADPLKIVVGYGGNAPAVEKYLEQRGIYPEFCDGQNVMFYLSPATKTEHLNALETALQAVAALQREGDDQILQRGRRSKRIAYLSPSESVGKTCAVACGLFPPCIPLIGEGEVITQEKIERLTQADNLFGLCDGKIGVYV